MNYKKLIVEYVFLQSLFALSSTVTLSYFYVVLTGHPTDFSFARIFPWIASFFMLFAVIGIRFYCHLVEAGIVGRLDVIKKIK